MPSSALLLTLLPCSAVAIATAGVGTSPAHACSREALQALPDVGLAHLALPAFCPCDLLAQDFLRAGFGFYFLFWFDRAADAFACAAQLSPSCAMAWVAISNDFSLWSYQDVATARPCIVHGSNISAWGETSRKCPATPLSPAAQAQERDIARAVGTLLGVHTALHNGAYPDPTAFPRVQRLQAAADMLHDAHASAVSSATHDPIDPHSTALGALAALVLISSGAPGTSGFSSRDAARCMPRALDIVHRVLDVEPAHAGALHALTHVRDTPGQAPLALLQVRGASAASARAPFYLV